MALACWGRTGLWTCMGRRDIAFLSSTAFVCRCTICIQRWQFLSKASSREKNKKNNNNQNWCYFQLGLFSVLAATRPDDRFMTSCCGIKQPLLWYVCSILYTCNLCTFIQATTKHTTSVPLTNTRVHHSVAANKMQRITHSTSQSMFCLQIMWNPLLLCPPPYPLGTRPEQ